MALERIFDVEDVNLLLEQNSASPLGYRNTALIMGGVYWGLTPLELSSVTVSDVIASNGNFFRIWVLPEDRSFNKEAREVHTEDHVLPFFEKYTEFRVKAKWGMSNLHSYRGLDPNSKFFLNDKGAEYALTKRKPKKGEEKKPAMYQPRSMNEQLKRMIARTNLYGATPASFRDSFIKGMYEAGAGWSDLMKVTGIKQKRTLENKVRPHERELEAVLGSLFSRVKMPDHLR
ncbi:site-specific integrase [Endozoicomonas sp. SM1973]|uniref:Site-specific integrase n=1 Tax=Spartinivicinus marinus TaxID=2994442 RepID=A0A853I1E3_9GAMM|nr:site-specific integrase [Spartinivicinus marinus]MCX4030147.1 site-specific integrase [Spartinivicinus marinus]NYZ67790.1 site-specific integrase [Spartinivicinus marinus]